MLNAEQIMQQLAAPFDPKAISWRVGSTNGDKTKGLALAYIDARDVMQRLDDVLGVDGWQDSYTETASGRIICTLKIRIIGEWISKSDGAGDTDVEGEKGAISDALKRAAVKCGVGRYLYYLDAMWTEIEPYGKSYRIKNTSNLYKMLPSFAIPGNSEKPKIPKPVEQEAPKLSPLQAAEKWALEHAVELETAGLWPKWNDAIKAAKMDDLRAIKAQIMGGK